jgi:hypothetical protein
MKTNFETMTKWEMEKAMYILVQAKELGMDLSSHGELSVNEYSGNTYLWLEDYEFAIYMPINCDLKREDIYVLYTDMETGQEHDESLKHFDTLKHIEEWIEEIKNEN